MLELTHNTAERAAARAHDRHPHVSRISDTEIAVSCVNPDHPGGHVARFERRADGSLWGECFLRGTGEPCPSTAGHRVCYHLTSGVVLFLALEVVRAAEDPAGAVEHAVTFDGALPPSAPRRRTREVEFRPAGARPLVVEKLGGFML